MIAAALIPVANAVAKLLGRRRRREEAGPEAARAELNHIESELRRLVSTGAAETAAGRRALETARARHDSALEECGRVLS
jgi:hypothetical protein